MAGAADGYRFRVSREGAFNVGKPIGWEDTVCIAAGYHIAGRVIETGRRCRGDPGSRFGHNTGARLVRHGNTVVRAAVVYNDHFVGLASLRAQGHEAFT
ncbi:MAG: hypothetical protein JWQ43_2938 [Glaciihabitans sp.]|nr:hypothetical protein [Glaciihabitans sp.]